MKRQDLDNLLKPFKIYVKTPSEETSKFYELWSEDGFWKIRLQTYTGWDMGWFCIEELVDDLCYSTHIEFIATEDGLAKHRSSKRIANPFCGCKSLDEMRIARDLAGW